LQKALYLSKIISYAQGFMLMKQISDTRGWDLDLGDIAHTWSGGCIIKSQFLSHIVQAYRENPDLEHMLFSNLFKKQISDYETNWRETLVRAIRLGVPMPAMASALSFFDALRSRQLPANLIQAQRDYFGAHMYERTDQPEGEYFHTNWTGQGGAVGSGVYNA
jgi:6-phosphogluconate dehydrogenase